MTAEIIELQPYRLKQIERRAAELLGQLLDYTEIARDGGPIVLGAIPVTDPWAGRHFPGGIDDL